jgi:hypothetical protein
MLLVYLLDLHAQGLPFERRTAELSRLLMVFLKCENSGTHQT